MSERELIIKEHLIFCHESEQAKILDLKWENINKELKDYLWYCKITEEEEKSAIYDFLICRKKFIHAINLAIEKEDAEEIHKNIERFNNIVQEAEELLKKIKEKYDANKITEGKEKESMLQGLIVLGIIIGIFAITWLLCSLFI